MRRPLLALIVAFAPLSAAAQTTPVASDTRRPAVKDQAAEGVRALLAGDVDRAIAILKPLAETTTESDPVAQFFLATAFHTGGPARYNLSRACGLYRSAASASGPLAPIAREIADGIEAQFGPRAGPTVCVSASTHPWGELPPAAFTLGPGYTIEITATTSTIVLNGERHTKRFLDGGPGTIFLPMQHTRLELPTPAPRPRHFLHLFVWHRNDISDTETWSLGWMLHEVVGANIATVAGDPRLITVAMPQPPPIDVSRLVQLRANANGEVEWRIHDPASPRVGVIK